VRDESAISSPSPPEPRTLSGLDKRAGERSPFNVAPLSIGGEMRSGVSGIALHEK